jgi:hypothetical protein
MSDLYVTGPTAQRLRIERISLVRHKYLWLKTVEAVNLAVHCYSSLVGQPLHVRRDAVEQEVWLPDAPAYYLCGVTDPYQWALNSHVLLVPDTTAPERTVTTPTLSVTMTGLRPLAIEESWLEDQYGGRRAYTTCRNLMGAWRLHKELGFPNQPGRTPKLARTQAAKAGAPTPPT